MNSGRLYATSSGVRQTQATTRRHCCSVCLVTMHTHACFRALETFVIIALYKSTFTIPYHTITHPFNGPFSGTTQVSQYQKGKTNLDFTEATDNHASTPPLGFLQAVCPSRCPTNSISQHQSASCSRCQNSLTVKDVQSVLPAVCFGDN